MLRTFVALLIGLAAHTAVATTESVPPVGGKPYEEQVTGGNEKFLLELKRRVESAGFSDVNVLPSMFVMTAKSRDGRSITLVVNSDTLRSLQIGAETEDQDSRCTATPEELKQLR